MVRCGDGPGTRTHRRTARLAGRTERRLAGGDPRGARQLEPFIEAADIIGGDAFQLFVADPADNPWLSAALDLGPPLVAQVIGYHGMRRRGRIGRFAAAAYRETKDWRASSSTRLRRPWAPRVAVNDDIRALFDEYVVGFIVQSTVADRGIARISA